MLSVPNHAQILVVGGGPGGSYAASVLAREGFDVVLLEAASFPRYHIGESLVPSCRPFLRLIDLEEEVIKHGFCLKPGAAFKLAQGREEGYTDFTAVDPQNFAWNVVRSEFDEMIFRHAAKSGARVFDRVRVESLEFEGSNPAIRPMAATWSSGHDKKEGRLTFDYLVDASGRAGLMSHKYLKNRQFNKSLNNVACWGYWRGAGTYMPNSKRHNAPWFEALTDESGWCWFIPLHNGATSVGIVENQAISISKKQLAKMANGGVAVTLRQHYLQCLTLCPGLLQLLRDAELLDDGVTSPIRAASDFSYSASCYSGDHYRIVGDAADPFFSSGVHLALSGALSASISIASSIRGEVPEADCSAYHDTKVSVSYTRFLIVVLSAYRQIRAQSTPIMSDINERDFRRAFDIIRPVIQGTADIDVHLSVHEVDNAMEFCKSIIGIRDIRNVELPEGAADEGNPVSVFVKSMARFGHDVVNGFGVRTERGHIGIVRL